MRSVATILGISLRDGALEGFSLPVVPGPGIESCEFGTVTNAIPYGCESACVHTQTLLVPPPSPVEDHR